MHTEITILPYHKYVKGNEDFSYLHRNSWGKGGHNDLLEARTMG